jgi:hypothetical protein
MTTAAAPGWVRIRGSTAVAETRNSFTSGLLTLFVVTFSLVPQLGVVGWYRVNRELRDLGYARGSDRLGHFPALSAAAYLMGTSILYLGVALLVAVAYAPTWLALQLGFLLGCHGSPSRCRRTGPTGVPGGRTGHRFRRPASGAAVFGGRPCPAPRRSSSSWGRWSRRCSCGPSRSRPSTSATSRRA